MKKEILGFLALVVVLFTACSSDDGPEMGEQLDIDPPNPLQEYVDKITRNGTELRFTYEGDKLVRNETNTYYRAYTYTGENITKIESITLPNTPYYTVNFEYDTSGKVTVAKRTNFHNNTEMIVTYEYNAGGKVSKTCIYDSTAAYNAGNCNRFYEYSYVGNTTNYAQKDLFLQSMNGFDVLEQSIWDFDTRQRPYFGNAVQKIQLPYATDGTGTDWEYVYNTNNPTQKNVFFNGAYKIRRSYAYTYNEANRPLTMEINTYSIVSGAITSTFNVAYTYVLR